LVRNPANDFVQTLIGDMQRPFRLLSVSSVGEALEPGEAPGTPLGEERSQQDALSELLWSGRTSAPVMSQTGAVIGRITLDALLKRAARPQ
jgi:osmoprotectant transport system ATP-binding protein